MTDEDLTAFFTRATRAAQRMVPVEVAEDIAQEAVLLLALRQHEVEYPEKWLDGVVRNKCVRWWKRRRHPLAPIASVDAMAESELPPVEPGQGLVDARCDLARRISKLPQGMQDAIRLRYVYGMRWPEASRVTGIGIETLRKLHSRGILRLRRSMGRSRRRGGAGDAAHD